MFLNFYFHQNPSIERKYYSLINYFNNCHLSVKNITIFNMMERILLKKHLYDKSKLFWENIELI